MSATSISSSLATALFQTRPELAQKLADPGSETQSSSPSGFLKARALAANLDLEESWNAVASQEKAPSAGKPTVKVSLNPLDGARNREIKENFASNHAKLDRQVQDCQTYFKDLGPGTHPDPKDPKGKVKISVENGWVTVRRTKTGKDGKTSLTEVRYSKSDPRDMDIRTNDGYSASRRDDRISCKLSDGTRFTQSQDSKGNITKKLTEPDGRSSTGTARADGSYRGVRTDGTTLTEAPDREMRKFEAFADRLSEHVDGNGKTRKLTSEERYHLAAGLRAYPMETLKNLERKGVKIEVVNPNDPPPGGFPGGRTQWKEGGAAYYSKEAKALVFREGDLVTGGSGEIADFVHHEVAHAADDLLQADPLFGRATMHSENDPRLQGLYSQYQDRASQDKKAIWSDYARTSPAEYFAEGVAQYLASDGARKLLKESDPGLYAYVKEHLKQAQDENLPRQTTWGTGTQGYSTQAGTGLDSQQMISMMQAVQAMQMRRIMQMMSMMMMGGGGLGMGFSFGGFGFGGGGLGMGSGFGGWGA